MASIRKTIQLQVALSNIDSKCSKTGVRFGFSSPMAGVPSQVKLTGCYKIGCAQFGRVKCLIRFLEQGSTCGASFRGNYGADREIS
jgi:hypothetical protein